MEMVVLGVCVWWLGGGRLCVYVAWTFQNATGYVLDCSKVVQFLKDLIPVRPRFWRIQAI